MPKLPLVGDVPKGWIYAVGGVSVAVIGYMWWKKKHAVPTASAATGTTVTDPAGNVCSAVNPLTGYCPGTAQDLAAQSSGFGSGPFAGGGGGGGTGGTTGTGPPFSSNAAWAAYAEQQLQLVGVDPIALSAAIGVYLTGRPATPDQVSLIDQAIAIAGPVPVADPSGFPPNIRQQPGGGGGGTPVPNVVGNNWMGAIRILTTAGFKPSPASKPANAKDPITGQSPAAGTTAPTGSTVTLTSPTR